MEVKNKFDRWEHFGLGISITLISISTLSLITMYRWNRASDQKMAKTWQWWVQIRQKNKCTLEPLLNLFAQEMFSTVQIMRIWWTQTFLVSSIPTLWPLFCHKISIFQRIKESFPTLSLSYSHNLHLLMIWTTANHSNRLFSSILYTSSTILRVGLLVILPLLIWKPSLLAMKIRMLLESQYPLRCPITE